MKVRNIILIALGLMFAFSGHAAKKRYKRDPLKSLNSLGADEQILKRVKSYKGKQRIRVIQKRAVDRDNRLEFAMNFGVVNGGDPYANTNSFGGQIDFHFNPRWSVGARYNEFKNSLNAEGQNVYEFSKKNVGGIPSIFASDHLLSSQTVSLNWYPIYGKMNLFDWKVAQFDFYFLAEGGQLQLQSGSTSTQAFGGGLGLWLTKYLSTRMEVKYQTYTDLVPSGPRDQDMMTVNFTLGFLL